MDRKARTGLKLVAAMMLAAFALPAGAQQTSEDVHAAERARFGFGELRGGADGNNPDAPNAANNDESKVGDYQVPPLFTSETQRTPAGWPARRAELARLVEDNWVGRIPETVRDFRIVWNKDPVPGAPAGAVQEQWVGQIIAPDGRMGPTIDATITFPRGAVSVPSFIEYTYMWPPGFTLGGGGGGGPRPPSAMDVALEHGWAHVAYRPQMLQADNGADMAKGVIGLARWPRAEHDWGALRAWGWGVSQLREEMARDPRLAGDRITLTGHSRYGKGVLVAAAFDPLFADAHVSSSGAGGAKLMRRDFGERWENLTASGEFHWLTPAAMRYSTTDLTIDDLPVDAHMLIALRAPHPLFVTTGRGTKGDSWVDPTGNWTATMLAEPAWALYGLPVPEGAMPPYQSSEQAAYPLAWYQHGEGHVPWPAFELFIAHAERFFGE